VLLYIYPASASSTASTFIVPNVTSLVTVNLEGPNYMSWATQFTPTLCTYDILGIVDGSKVCP
jgi:hypothetical protein